MLVGLRDVGSLRWKCERIRNGRYGVSWARLSPHGSNKLVCEGCDFGGGLQAEGRPMGPLRRSRRDMLHLLRALVALAMLRTHGSALGIWKSSMGFTAPLAPLSAPSQAHGGGAARKGAPAPVPGPMLFSMVSDAAGSKMHTRVLRMRRVARKNGMVRLFFPRKAAAGLPFAEAEPQLDVTLEGTAGKQVAELHAAASAEQASLDGSERTGAVAPNDTGPELDGGAPEKADHGSEVGGARRLWAPPDRTAPPSWAHPLGLNDTQQASAVAPETQQASAVAPEEHPTAPPKGHAGHAGDATPAAAAPGGEPTAPHTTAVSAPAARAHAPLLEAAAPFGLRLPPHSSATVHAGAPGSLAGLAAELQEGVPPWRDAPGLSEDAAAAVAALARLARRIDDGSAPWRLSAEDGPVALRATASSAARAVAGLLWRAALLAGWAAVLGVRTALWAAVWAVDYAAAREFWLPEAAEWAVARWRSRDSQRAAAAVRWAWAEGLGAAATLLTWLSSSLSPVLRERARAAAAGATRLAGQAGLALEGLEAPPESRAAAPRRTKTVKRAAGAAGAAGAGADAGADAAQPRVGLRGYGRRIAAGTVRVSGDVLDNVGGSIALGFGGVRPGPGAPGRNRTLSRRARAEPLRAAPPPCAQAGASLAAVFNQTSGALGAAFQSSLGQPGAKVSGLTRYLAQ
jgi:hypothetical protein